MKCRLKYFLGLFCIAILFACQRIPHPINEITKIELARSGAWTDWGAAISIDSSLQYKYYGIAQPGDRRYYYTGKVTALFWDTLNRKLEDAHFKTTVDTNIIHTVDINYFELIIYWKNGKRRIVRMKNYHGDDSITKAMLWINQSSHKVTLTRIDHPISFESTFQNPPAPRVDQIRFPPPIKRQKKHE